MKQELIVFGTRIKSGSDEGMALAPVIRWNKNVWAIVAWDRASKLDDPALLLLGPGVLVENKTWESIQ